MHLAYKRSGMQLVNKGALSFTCDPLQQTETSQKLYLLCLSIVALQFRIVNEWNAVIATDKWQPRRWTNEQSVHAELCTLIIAAFNRPNLHASLNTRNAQFSQSCFVTACMDSRSTHTPAVSVINRTRRSLSCQSCHAWIPIIQLNYIYVVSVTYLKPSYSVHVIYMRIIGSSEAAET